MMHFTLCGAAAAQFHAHLVRREKSHRILSFGGCGADREFKAGCRLHGNGFSGWGIQQAARLSEYAFAGNRKALAIDAKLTRTY